MVKPEALRAGGASRRCLEVLLVGIDDAVAAHRPKLPTFR
jgi:hypothetical protein